MTSTSFPSRVTLLVLGVLGAAMAACSAPPADDGATSGEDQLVSDAASMTQKPDGTWDVVCKDGRHQNVPTADILADKVCNGDLPITCVQKCAKRYDNGNCQTYAPDFCAPAASCTKQCAARYDNGNCQTYAEDSCGPAEMCISHCTARYD